MKKEVRGGVSLVLASAMLVASPMAAGMTICSPDSPEHAVGMVANAAPSPDGGYAALAVIQENFVEGALTLETAAGPTFSVERLG